MLGEDIEDCRLCALLIFCWFILNVNVEILLFSGGEELNRAKIEGFLKFMNFFVIYEIDLKNFYKKQW